MAVDKEILKNRVKNNLQRVLDKVTPNQARLIVLILTAVLMLLFGATAGGRTIMTWIGYILTLGTILALGYRLYKYAEANAKGVPKPKKEKESPAEEEADDESSDDAEASEEEADIFDTSAYEEPAQAPVTTEEPAVEPAPIPKKGSRSRKKAE